MSIPVIPVRVVKKIAETTDICTFELAEIDGAKLPSFSPGSHIDVHIGKDLVRQYSLCNNSSETHRYLIGVLRDPNSRGGSRAMHDNINENDVINISVPKNHFPLLDNAKRSLLLAGGIGVTPILCMAERLALIGSDVEMHYSASSPARMAFRQRISASTFANRVHFHFDDGNKQQKLNLDDLLRTPGQDVHLYVCGPKGFMDVVLATARKSGWQEAQLHYEFFSAEVVKTDRDTAFQVMLARSGRIIDVSPNTTVTKALAAAGIDIPVSCEQGICGTCLTHVVEGVPDHRDMYLTDEEKAQNDQFTPCCSRSCSPILVLDLD
ncbi:PDR/VanB family oxidoreductase [Paraburkholderia aromaticivorans]|uniref:PDR/VanB family oxidoreductase n=1 Tax=Paraburkholderia aromaticivorans TaxID=2026199 RepID=UPI001455FB56|nr:PDR/VanB family oxidoreductase [Paraburkholderia aromaticivorans]